MTKTLPAIKRLGRSQMRRTVAGVTLQRSLEKGAWFATIKGRKVKFYPILGKCRDNDVLGWEVLDMDTQRGLGIDRSATLTIAINRTINALR